MGGGCVEHALRLAAHEMVLRGIGGRLTYELDHDFGYDDGMICGGSLEVGVQCMVGQRDAEALSRNIVELRNGLSTVLTLRFGADGKQVGFRIRVEGVPKLLIAGGGHITRCLAPLAGSIGFAVHVVDDRTEYANEIRFPPPTHFTVGDIPGILRNWPIDANTYIVIVTRGHKHDEAALAAVLYSDARYVGMIGSTRKVNVVFDDLRNAGVLNEPLSRVHAPIGIPIRAKTAEEIAVSIAAELIKVRRSVIGVPVEGPFDVEHEQERSKTT